MATVDTAIKPIKRELEDSCVSKAVRKGLISAAQASVVIGGIFYSAMKYSYTFKYNFNTSTKTALLIMPIIYTGWLNMEHTMHECIDRTKGQYVLADDDAVPE